MLLVVFAVGLASVDDLRRRELVFLRNLGFGRVPLLTTRLLVGAVAEAVTRGLMGLSA